MELSCKFIVLVLLCVNVEFILGKPSRNGGGGGGSRRGGSSSIYTLPAYSLVVHQQMANQRARNHATNSGSSSYLGNSGNWANPNVANVIHGIPMPRAPQSHDKPESYSDSDEISYEKDLVYNDESDNENGYASFKYGDDGMAMVY